RDGPQSQKAKEREDYPHGSDDSRTPKFRNGWVADIGSASAFGHCEGMAHEVFVFLARGVAGPSTGYPAGTSHALLVYVGDSDIEQAQVRAVEFFAESGWLDARISRAGTVGCDVAHIED